MTTVTKEMIGAAHDVINVRKGDELKMRGEKVHNA